MGRRKRSYTSLIANLAMAREAKRLKQVVSKTMTADSQLGEENAPPFITTVITDDRDNVTYSSCHPTCIPASEPPSIFSDILNWFRMGDQPAELTSEHRTFTPTVPPSWTGQDHSDKPPTEPQEFRNTALSTLVNDNDIIPPAAKESIPATGKPSHPYTNSRHTCRSVLCEEIFDDEDDLVAVRGPRWREYLTVPFRGTGIFEEPTGPEDEQTEPSCANDAGFTDQGSAHTHCQDETVHPDLDDATVAERDITCAMTRRR